MTPALTFATPLLLVGLLAAAIPPLLHLLSRARAKEVAFPTLRFLALSMERTARRRRIRQWLLMAVRCGLLALLAVGVAEPISRAAGAWLGGAGGAAAIVLDNSMSMSARAAEDSALGAAKAQAASLLEGPGRPELAAVLTTNGGINSTELTTRLDLLREGLGAVDASLARAPIAQRVQAAATLLGAQESGRKTLAVWGDLQQISFKELAAQPAGPDGGQIDLWIVNTSAGPSENVAVSDLRTSGQGVVSAVMTFAADLLNSGPGERVVDVDFQITTPAGETQTRAARVNLGPGGSQGARAMVRFQHRFTAPGLHTGRIAIERDDDLPADNVRYFCLTVAGRVEPVVIEGGQSGGAGLLMLALDPFGDPNAPWPIRPRRVSTDRFVPADLGKTSAAFFCNVPSFTPAAAAAIRQFARGGGTAVWFLGPDVAVDNYNQLLGSAPGTENALLPGRLAPAIGQVGPQAPAVGVDAVDIEHPYLSGLYEKPADYRTVLVQRRFPLAVAPADARVLMRLADGNALLVARPYGRGAVVLCTTSAEPHWSNLPLTGLFLPLVSRICLLSAAGDAGQDYLAGSAVTIIPKLPAGAMIRVTPPAEGDQPPAAISVPLSGPPDAPHAAFTGAQHAGIYRWAAGSGQSGAFAVNPDGTESDLSAMDAAAFQVALAKAGWRSVVIGGSLAEVRAAAAAQAAGHNWWDLFVAAVILLLVAEALVANRLSPAPGAATAAAKPAGA